MRRIKYTHGYDLLVKVGFVVAATYIWFVLFMISIPVTDSISEYLKSKDFNALLILVYIIRYFGLIVLTIAVLMNTIFPHWLSTYLYVRLSLRTKISREEADKLDFIFSGTLSRNWYPLIGVKKVNMFARRPLLFALANDIASRDNRREPFPVNGPASFDNKPISALKKIYNLRYWIALSAIMLIQVLGVVIYLVFGDQKL